MVDIDGRIKAIIYRLIEELKRNNIPIDRVVLFGSNVEGCSSEYSDIDLLVVSPLFEGKRMRDKDKIRKYLLNVSSELDVIPCSREEYKSGDPFIDEILKKGIEIEF